MKYGVEATKGLSSIIEEGIKKSGAFSISVLDREGKPGELNMPPVIEIVRAMSSDNGLDTDSMDKLARYCLMNRIIRVEYDNSPIGDIVINGLSTPWDSYEVLKKYPLALMFIINVCAAHVIKKSIPPQVEKAK